MTNPPHKPDYFPWITCGIFLVAASLVSIYRYWQYDVYYYDFGIFDQAIWNASRFRLPTTDHLEIGGKVIFADHFSPSMFLLAPALWIVPKQEMLLFLQAISVSLSGFVLYRICQTLLGNRWQSRSVLLSYFLFIGLQNALITDIHEVTVMTLPLMLAFWAIVNRHKYRYWVALIIVLGFKESAFLVGGGLALFIFLYERSWWKHAMTTFVLSAAWGYLATAVIIPFFSGKPYMYSPSIPLDISEIVIRFIDDETKRNTLLYSFMSFGFLPVFFPPMYPLILQDFFVRFVPDNTYLRWGLGMHYSAQLSPILGVASAFGLKRLNEIHRLPRFIPQFIIPTFLIGISLFVYQFKFHGPLGLSYNFAFYQHTENFKFMESLLSRIPPETTVMAQNNIAPHLIHTHQVYLLRDNYGDYLPDYIVLDVRSGQNPINFFGVKDPSALLSFLRTYETRYVIDFQTDEQFIFRKI